jgi:hypothetical protein
MVGWTSYVRIVATLACLTILTRSAFAQPADSVRGIVVDATSVPVASATVTLRDATGTVRRATTDSDGRFDIDGSRVRLVRRHEHVVLPGRALGILCDLHR